MKCPVDDEPLSISSREGVEIDFCPKCRGVWLDRGELDKILDRVATAAPAEVSSRPEPPRSEPRYDGGDRYDSRYDDRYDSRYDDRGKGRKKRRGGFLEDLFDFD